MIKTKTRTTLLLRLAPNGGPQVKNYYECKARVKSFTLVRRRYLRRYYEFPKMPRPYYRRDGSAGLKIRFKF